MKCCGFCLRVCSELRKLGEKRKAKINLKKKGKNHLMNISLIIYTSKII